MVELLLINLQLLRIVAEKYIYKAKLACDLIVADKSASMADSCREIWKFEYSLGLNDGYNIWETYVWEDDEWIHSSNNRKGHPKQVGLRVCGIATD